MNNKVLPDQKNNNNNKVLSESHLVLSNKVFKIINYIINYIQHLDKFLEGANRKNGQFFWNGWSRSTPLNNATFQKITI